MDKGQSSPPNTASDEKPVCGIVMPLSLTDGLADTHWKEVRSIIDEAVTSAGFLPRMVSEADDVGTIHKRIVQNLYENPIVVCDVSGRNPNVMLELGLRLAFDKPVVIVKDDITPYSFDTGQIEHIPYRRDLRYSSIEGFKAELTKRVRATHDKALSDANFTTFLKHFGTFNVAKLDRREVEPMQYLMEQLRSEIQRLQHINSIAATGDFGPGISRQSFNAPAVTLPQTIKFFSIPNPPFVPHTHVDRLAQEFHLRYTVEGPAVIYHVESIARGKALKPNVERRVSEIHGLTAAFFEPFA
jgi:hypothetical protein